MPRKATPTTARVAPTVSHTANVFGVPEPIYRRPWFVAAVVLPLFAVGILLWQYRSDIFGGDEGRFYAAYHDGRFAEASEIAFALAAEDPSAPNLRLVAKIQAEIARAATGTVAFQAAIDSALQAALAAERAGAKDAAAESALGYVYLVKGDLEAALDRYQRALAADPNSAAALAGSAAALDRQGREAAADALFARALEADSDDAEIRLAYARARAGNGYHEPAIALAAPLLDARERIYAAEANRLTAAGLTFVGDTNEAQAPAARALELAPEWPTVVSLQGELLLRRYLGSERRQLPRAETLARILAFADQAIALNPNLAAPHVLAFRAAFLQGDSAAAAGYAERARALFGTDATLSDEDRDWLSRLVDVTANVRTEVSRVQ